MWKIKQIFDGDYGCEEHYVSTEDAWLVERGLDEGSQWPQDTPVN